MSARLPPRVHTWGHGHRWKWNLNSTSILSVLFARAMTLPAWRGLTGFSKKLAGMSEFYSFRETHAIQVLPVTDSRVVSACIHQTCEGSFLFWMALEFAIRFPHRTMVPRSCC